MLERDPAGGSPVERRYNRGMPERTVREQIMQALEDLPPDATFEDAIERLVFLAKIDEGLAELDAGKGIPHDEVKRRLGM
jgi:predicted transcriptional regulator